METRANYVLIGACALAGILLGLGFFVWLAKFQIDRQYAYYDVLFDNVSGLSRAADVRFSGLSVGQVVSLDLDDDGIRAGAGADRGRGRHADPRGRDRAAAGPGRDRRLARLADRGRRRRSRCCATRRRAVPVIQGAAVGGAVADRGRARPPHRVDQAGEGVPGHRRAGEPGQGRGDPRQRRAGLGRVRDGADRLLVDLAVGRRRRPARSRPSPTSSTRSPTRVEKRARRGARRRWRR